MKLAEFRTFVAEHAQWFRGVVRETPASLADAEKRMAVDLPDSLKWLLSTWGYSESCGLPSLEDAVEATLRCRAKIGLPNRYVILEDRNDAGVVFLDVGASSDREACPIHWVGSHNFPRLAENTPMDADCDSFAGFTEWVASELRRVQEEEAESSQ
jgi:hypothetical protein